MKYVLVGFLLAGCASGFTVETIEHSETMTLFHCVEKRGLFQSDLTISVCQNPVMCAMVCDLYSGRKMRPPTDVTDLLVPKE